MPGFVGKTSHTAASERPFDGYPFLSIASSGGRQPARRWSSPSGPR